TLYGISQRFAVTMKSIRKRNRMGKDDTIQPGQKLKLRGRKVKL
ncbi:MAG: LysM repeat protein, partial [Glaciecola sp.]